MDGLGTQIQVITALVLRELKTRFGREQLGYVWAFFEPLMFVGVFAGIFYLAERPAPAGMPTLLFLVTGIVPFILFRDCMMRAMSAIGSNRPLLMFPQVTPLDLVVGRALLEAATKIVVFVMLAALGLYISDTVRVENALLVGFYLLCLALMGFGFGAFLGSFTLLFPSVEQFVGPMSVRPLFLCSGLFFTVGMLPEVARDYALINPLLHCSELLRNAFFVQFESNYGDVRYVLMWVLIDLFFGLVAQRALRQKILAAAQRV